MKNYYNIILSLTILSLMSVGWGQVFYDNFDDGIWDDMWSLSDPSYTIEFDEGADGTNFSLKLIGSSVFFEGLSTSFEPAQPSYISIYIKPQLDRNYANSYFVIGDATVDPIGNENNNSGLFFLVNEDYCGYIAFEMVSSSGEIYCYGDLVEEWYHIEFKNIDFNSHTFDWFVNGAIVHESAGFRDNVSSFNQIHLFNRNSSSYENAWYDEIYIGDEPLDGSGCTDPSACNYDPDATEDDGSCEYEVDCAGECGGDAQVDECGVCDGDGSACDDSNIMNVITGIVQSYGDNYQGGIGAGFMVFNDPITEDINMSLNGEILSKKRTYHYGGPMGGYTFETDDEFEYADSVNLSVSGDFNFDYTVFMPTNMMITSHNEGDAIDPSQDMIITYTASNYDFFYFSYNIYYQDFGYQYYSGFTYDTSFTIQSELLNNASEIYCDISALNGKHPIDEVLDYSQNTMASIFGSNSVDIYFGDFNREESQQGTHHSIIDLWESGEFSRLYSQFITESEDNSDYQLMDITSDDIFIYSVMMEESDYYGYDENIIYPFIIISSPIYFEDTQIFVNEVEIETYYGYPFGIATVFGEGGEFAEYPTSQDINSYEIHINGEVISGEFTFSDSTEFTNWTSGQSYDGAEDLYIEWADNEADFYSVKIYAWDWTGYQSCSLDTVVITEDSNFTIANTFFTNCLSDGSVFEVRVTSVNGALPVAGTSGDIENSYGFSWTWSNYISLNIPYNSGGSFDGCTDPEACNYDETATQDDGSCEYPDCAGECGGTAEIDECGECGGSGIPDGECDCDGNVLDECGVCGGDGAVFGDTGCCEIDVDECGLCDGENVCADDAVGDWMVHYSVCPIEEYGTEVFSIYEDGTFYEAQCGGGTWTQDGDVITLYMSYCGVEWTGTLSGNSIIDGTYSNGYGVYCWFAERLLASTTYINDLTYTGESIVDPVEMTFTPSSWHELTEEEYQLIVDFNNAMKNGEIVIEDNQGSGSRDALDCIECSQEFNDGDTVEFTGVYYNDYGNITAGMTGTVYGGWSEEFYPGGYTEWILVEWDYFVTGHDGECTPQCGSGGECGGTSWWWVPCNAVINTSGSEPEDCFVVGPDADCAGVCFGDAVVDECDECGGNGINSNDYGDCECQIVGDLWADCAGECGGSAEVDECGICGGDAVVDCAGQCGGDAEVDECGVCDSDVENDCEPLVHLSIANVNIDAATLDINITNTAGCSYCSNTDYSQYPELCVELGNDWIIESDMNENDCASNNGNWFDGNIAGLSFFIEGITMIDISGGVVEYLDYTGVNNFADCDGNSVDDVGCNLIYLASFNPQDNFIPAGTNQLLLSASFIDFENEICFPEEPNPEDVTNTGWTPPVVADTQANEIYHSHSDCYTPPECDVALGDVNGDGDINIFDLVQIAYYILELSIPDYECAADYNQDGSVDILDLVEIVNIILFDE